MALELSLADDFGNAYPAAYRRVSYFMIDDESSAIVIQTVDYKDAAAAARDDRRRSAQRPFRVNPPRIVTLDTSPGYVDYTIADAANPAGTKATIYDFLKTLPENAGAKDV